MVQLKGELCYLERNHVKREENQDVKEDGKNTEFFSPQLTKI